MTLPLLFCLVTQTGGVPASIAPSATLTLPTGPVRPGKPYTASLKLTFKPGLHGYQNPPSDPLEIPVEVKVKAGSSSLVTVHYPKGIPFGNPPVNVYSGTVTIPITLKAGKKSGPISLVINYQQCTDTSCYRPSVLTATAMLVVAKS